MYRLDDHDIAEQIVTLPADARAAFEELRDVLSLVPWRGEPVAQRNPDSGLRFMAFRSAHGSGFVYYLILEDLQRVDLLELIWLG